VNYPAHRAGRLKKFDKGDCIPLTPAPHSSQSTGQGILQEDFIKFQEEGFMALDALGKVFDNDIIVIGGGIGGHTFAITAKENNPALRILLVEKATAGLTGPSALVGGRYGGFLPESDDFDEYLKDEVKKENDYLCNQDVIEDHLKASGLVLRSLEKWGVKFVKTPGGQYERPPSRGNTCGMLLDGGGIPAMKAINDYARKIGVNFQNHVMVTDLITDENRIAGAVGFHVRKGKFCIFTSKAAVLATGMTRFKNIQPGHRNDTGDGYAMAYRAGAELGGFDSTRHNTYATRLELGPGNNLYVGMGAYFLNSKGERFMHNYHPELAERAPFVWLSPAFCVERMEHRAPPIYLDMRHFTPDKLQVLWQSIPYAMIKYERAGIIKGNKFVELIEYTPEGARPSPCGIVTDRNYRSRNLSGLFAIGDASLFKGCGGISGAAVSGAIAGKYVAESIIKMDNARIDQNQIDSLKKSALAPMMRKDGIEPDHIILAIQEVVNPYYVTIIRHEKRLREALEQVERIKNTLMPLLHAYDSHYLMSANEVRNMVLCAEMVIRSALERKESRLGRLRQDYKEMDNINWLKYINLKQVNGVMKVWSEDVPIEKYRLKPTREKVIHPFWKRIKDLGYLAESHE
jgi:succinate dehydrogenase / fumarate reductase flavoprotein subunit